MIVFPKIIDDRNLINFEHFLLQRIAFERSKVKYTLSASIELMVVINFSNGRYKIDEKRTHSHVIVNQLKSLILLFEISKNDFAKEVERKSENI